MCSQRYRISAWCFQTRHGGTDCIPNHREDSGGRTLIKWEFQDPKMEVLYHIRPYFVGIFPYIGLTLALYMVGTSGLGSWNGHWLSVVWLPVRGEARTSRVVEGNSLNDESTEAAHPVWLQYDLQCFRATQTRMSSWEVTKDSTWKIYFNRRQ